jgi:hypothetical protein
MPGVFATFGLMTGAVGAFLYNLVAGRVGGWHDKGPDPNDLPWKDWGVSILGGAIVGAVVGAILGGFFGNVLGLVRHHLR